MGLLTIMVCRHFYAFIFKGYSHYPGCRSHDLCTHCTCADIIEVRRQQNITRKTKTNKKCTISGCHRAIHIRCPCVDIHKTTRYGIAVKTEQEVHYNKWKESLCTKNHGQVKKATRIKQNDQQHVHDNKIIGITLHQES